MGKNHETKSMPEACILAYLFPDRFLGAMKQGNTNHQCIFEFEPSTEMDEFTYQEIHAQLYSKESIIVGNALEFIIACGIVKKAVSMAHKGLTYS